MSAAPECHRALPWPGLAAVACLAAALPVLCVIAPASAMAATAAAAAAAASSTPAPPAVITTGGHATVASESGRPPRYPEPTYAWHGLTVPAGACGATVAGRPWVLPCADRRVVAYRRLVTRQRARRHALLADGLAAGVALAAAGGWMGVRRGWSGGRAVKRDA